MLHVIFARPQHHYRLAGRLRDLRGFHHTVAHVPSFTCPPPPPRKGAKDFAPPPPTPPRRECSYTHRLNRKHLADARNRLRLRRVKRLRLAAEHWATRHNRELHARNSRINSK